MLHSMDTIHPQKNMRKVCYPLSQMTEQRHAEKSCVQIHMAGIWSKAEHVHGERKASTRLITAYLCAALAR